MRRILISIARQTLRLQADDKIAAEYRVSTARSGAGELRGSMRTPRGLHGVRAKIGAGANPGTVFVGRRATGRVLVPGSQPVDRQRDWITSRILWLTGREPGRNRGGEVDTLRRLVYIHGSPHTELLGIPCSCGCVRMSDMDVIDLFDRVRVGDGVSIG